MGADDITGGKRAFIGVSGALEIDDTLCCESEHRIRGGRRESWCCDDITILFVLLALLEELVGTDFSSKE